MTLTTTPALVLRLGKLVCPTTTTPGAVVPTPTDVWFPVAPTVTDLPAAPTYNTEPELVPANSALVDACFDPDNVDVEQLFNNFIPAGDTDPVYDVSANVTVLIQPKNETVPVRYRLRSVLVALYANYSVKPKVSTVSDAIKSVISVFSFKYKLSAVAGNFVSEGQQLFGSRVYSVSGGSYIYDPFKPFDLRFILPFAGFVPTNYLIKPEANLILLGQFDTSFADSGPYNVSLAKLDQASSVPVISTSVVKYGSGSLYIRGTDSTNSGKGFQFYLNTANSPGASEDFMVSCWINPSNLLLEEVIWGVDYSVEGGVGAALMISRQSAGVSVLGLHPCVSPETSLSSAVLAHPTLILDNQWYYIVLQRINGKCVIFVDGVPSSLETLEFSLKNRNMIGNYNALQNNFHLYQFNGYIDSFAIFAGAPYALSSFTSPNVAERSGRLDSASFSLVKPVSGDAGTFSLAASSIDLTYLVGLESSESATFNFSGAPIDFARPSRSSVVQVGSYSAQGQNNVDYPTIVTSQFSAFGSTGNVTITWSGLEQVGDIAFLSIEGDSNLWVPLLPPGWQQVSASPVNTNSGTAGTALLVFWKRITTVPETSFTVRDVGDHILTQVTLWRGAKTSGDVIGVYSSGTFTTTSTSHSVPGISTTANNSTVLLFCATPADSSSPWGLTTNTVLVKQSRQITGTTQGNGGGLLVFYGGRNLPGPSGTTTVAITTSQQLAYIVVELLART